jgi:hypothetical protein
MNQVNPYLKTRESVLTKLGTENPNLFSEHGPVASTALQAAMQKAKAYEADAGAAATGDIMAQVRNAGKGESIKRDVDEDQILQEFKTYILKSMLKMQMTWVA